MEKEKKPRTIRKATTKTQPAAAEAGTPKKTATRKKAGPVALNANGAEPPTVMARKKEPINLTAQKISHEEIARLAHRYWAERGHQHGNHVDDWLRAERELRGKASSAGGASLLLARVGDAAFADGPANFS